MTAKYQWHLQARVAKGTARVAKDTARNPQFPTDFVTFTEKLLFYAVGEIWGWVQLSKFSLTKTETCYFDALNYRPEDIVISSFLYRKKVPYHTFGFIWKCGTISNY